MERATIVWRLAVLTVLGVGCGKSFEDHVREFEEDFEKRTGIGFEDCAALEGEGGCEHPTVRCLREAWEACTPAKYVTAVNAHYIVSGEGEACEVVTFVETIERSRDVWVSEATVVRRRHCRQLEFDRFQFIDQQYTCFEAQDCYDLQRL